MWIEVNTTEIEAINANSPIHKITPIQTIDGDWVVLDDLLTDAVAFGHAFYYLNLCPKVELTVNDFPIPEMPW